MAQAVWEGHLDMAFYRLARLDQLYDGVRLPITIHSEPSGAEALLLLQQNGQLFIVENRCPHQDFPLHQATVRGQRLICPRHGFAFHLQTGECWQAPSCRLKTWPVSYDGQWVGIERQEDPQ